jgi:hypothetical protein
MPDPGTGKIAVNDLPDEQTDGCRRVQNALAKADAQVLADPPNGKSGQNLRGVILDLIDSGTDTSHPWPPV